MKISFTTLACPDWSWEKIVEEAARLGYDGIEVRGIGKEMFLPKCAPFLPENRTRTMKELESKGLEICCLDTSCVFHNEQNFNASVEEGKATIDLAQSLGVPYIRIFGDAIPYSDRREQTIAQVARGAAELSRYAEGKSVQVLLETHGDFADSNAMLAVIDAVDSEAFGVLWDINNPYKYEPGETMIETYDKLGRHIKHTHIKDTLGRGPAAKIMLAGEGDVPISECVSILRNNGYEGWLSFEWEKRWHPDIEEPEVALPQFIRHMKSMP
ncbi:sugar phosphate isomerase/epimerase [Cohnella pontilimi]|uniref:Sugar phosphate isomerase/epimerase n=1 Tax=Cohnella pontilimi TaxID=2564100 RepID=A0A4U0FGQ8_9BACL|nr:sugar phosphate isomerase/epimerase family protein [Cohnella pontilimi]TJY44117.1 sugar phosphate isomerase/epimerase [Cohnella pontilimi]